MFRENARRCHCSVDFSQLADPAQRLTAKEYLYARLHEPAGGPRPRLAPASVRAVFNRLRRFMTFVESQRGQFDLDLLDQADLDAWLAQLRRRAASVQPQQIASLLDVPADLIPARRSAEPKRLYIHALARPAGVAGRRLPAGKPGRTVRRVSPNR